MNGCLAATPARVVVRRNGRLETFEIRPRYSAADKRMEVGFEYGVDTVPAACHAAPISARNLWSVATRTVSTVARIFEPQERKQLHSIVYGYTATQESFATSTTQALWVLALISLSLGIINLFPFLPLGRRPRLLGRGREARGKRIPFEVMERAGMVGFALILLIFVIGLTNDISTLSGSGFSPPCPRIVSPVGAPQGFRRAGRMRSARGHPRLPPMSQLPRSSTNLPSARACGSSPSSSHVCQCETA